METVIGDGSLFMVGVHIAHDCVIENNVIFANQATLGGHVYVKVECHRRYLSCSSIL